MTVDVARLTNDGEKAHLDAVLSSPPRRVLVASDLHLGPGRDRSTGVYAARENFFGDEAFARWLSSETEKDSLLLLNGDVFDFLRVLRTPHGVDDLRAWGDALARLGYVPSQPLSQALKPHERIHGFGTEDLKTVWKLRVIARGHPAFFAALAAWLSRGGIVLMTKGNHDLELHWPLVRQAVRDAIVEQGAPAAAAMERVAFALEGFTVDNLFVEHGHRHELLTRVVGPVALVHRPSQLNLPFGSFIGRYYVNHIERLDPFIDNIKPVASALLSLLRRRPVAIYQIYVKSAKFIPRAFAMRRPLPVAVAAALLILLLAPPATLSLLLACLLSDGVRGSVQAQFGLLATRWGQILGAAGGILLPALLPYVLGILGDLARGFGLDHLGPSFEEKAARALRQALPVSSCSDRVYAVLGHTHVQDAVRLPAGTREEIYVNSGTWTPLWPRDRKDLMGRVIFSFIRFTRAGSGGYVHEMLEWDDAALAARPARILVESEDDS